MSMYHHAAPKPVARVANKAMRINKLLFIGAILRRGAVAAQASLCYGT